MGMRFGVTEENKAQINLDPYGNVSVFNININNVSTMDMDNASTTFHNTLNVENVSVGGSLSVTGSIEGYQETLIAGTNITITGNTISSAGSGGTLPANANFSSVNTSTLNASTIDTSGNITSPKWNVLKPVFNLTDRFPNSSGATQVTVATSVVITGNFILHYYNSGFRTSTGLGIFLLYAVPNAGGSNILIGNLRQYWNSASFHLAFSQSNYVTNVPAGTYSLLLTRNNTTLRHDANDFLTVIMEMVPF